MVIRIIPFIKDEAKDLNLVFKWILKFHQEKFAKAFIPLSYASPQTVEQMEFFKNKIFVSRVLNDQKEYKYIIKAKIKGQIIEKTLENISIRVTKAVLSSENFNSNLYLAIIANDLNENEIVSEKLTSIIKNFESYYKIVTKDTKMESHLAYTLMLAIKCTEPKSQIEIIKQYEKILSVLKFNTLSYYIYIDLLINLNKFDNVESLIKSMLNNEKDSNIHESAAVLYENYTTKLVKLSMNDDAWKFAMKSYEQFQLSSNFSNKKIESFYSLLLSMITISFKIDKEDIIEQILNNLKDHGDKKLLLFYYSHINKMFNYHDHIESQILIKKFSAIDKFKIHPILVKCYDLLNIYIKYSQINVNNIDKKQFYEDIGGVNCDKTTRQLMIELCVEFKQLDLAKKLMLTFTIDQFGNQENYLWHKYTLLQIDEKVIIKEVDSYIYNNDSKAYLYYELAAYQGVNNCQLALLFLDQINKLYDKNLLSRNEDFEKEFSKLKFIIKIFKALETKDFGSIENSESKSLEKITEEKEAIVDHTPIENYESKSLSITIEERKNTNSNKNNSKEETKLLTPDIIEPDFENMSSEAIYRYYEAQRKTKNLPAIKDIPCYLKGISKRAITNHQESTKTDSPWYYKGQKYNKEECFKLDHTLPNGQIVQKCHAIIDPKIRENIENPKAVTQALAKEYIGSHK